VEFVSNYHIEEARKFNWILARTFIGKGVLFGTVYGVFIGMIYGG